MNRSGSKAMQILFLPSGQSMQARACTESVRLRPSGLANGLAFRAGYMLLLRSRPSGEG